MGRRRNPGQSPPILLNINPQHNTRNLTVNLIGHTKPDNPPELPPADSGIKKDSLRCFGVSLSKIKVSSMINSVYNFKSQSLCHENSISAFS